MAYAFELCDNFNISESSEEFLGIEILVVESL